MGITGGVYIDMAPVAHNLLLHLSYSLHTHALALDIYNQRRSLQPPSFSVSMAVRYHVFTNLGQYEKNRSGAYGVVAFYGALDLSKSSIEKLTNQSG
jgi:hypothetical protein